MMDMQLSVNCSQSLAEVWHATLELRWNKGLAQIRSTSESFPISAEF
jgi:hypothetical protein